ncbi:MAG: class I SAM-dependent methyltransferase [Pseudomonadota bacterium]
MIDQATQERWDRRYRDMGLPGAPATVLLEYGHLLPAQGTALDLACGLGANSLLLAEHGLLTQAWDISPVAIEKLQAIAVERKLPVQAVAKDVLHAPIPPTQFDVIVVSHYLERALTRPIIHGLKVGGLLFYQTFTRTTVNDEGPEKPEWRLADGELLTMFAPLRTLVYREEGRIGDTTQGFRNKALLVAIKETARTGDGVKVTQD